MEGAARATIGPGTVKYAAIPGDDEIVRVALEVVGQRRLAALGSDHADLDVRRASLNRDQAALRVECQGVRPVGLVEVYRYLAVLIDSRDPVRAWLGEGDGAVWKRDGSFSALKVVLDDGDLRSALDDARNVRRDGVGGGSGAWPWP